MSNDRDGLSFDYREVLALEEISESLKRIADALEKQEEAAAR